MKFSVIIDCDNAAFEDNTGELVRILRDLTNYIDYHDSIPLEKVLMDINGNKVGLAQYLGDSCVELRL